MPLARSITSAAALAAALFFFGAAATDAAAEIKPYAHKSGSMMPKKVKPALESPGADSGAVSGEKSGGKSGEKSKDAPATEAVKPKPAVFKGPKRVLAPPSIE